MEIAYIGLGSNLDQPVEHVLKAYDDLAALPQTQTLRLSSLYGSKPLGPQDQPDYVNAVAEITTALDAEALLHALFVIEAEHGRIRTGTHWTARPLDLDLLLYGQLTCHTDDLTVPHPHLCTRSFVVFPLSELVADLQLPDGRALATCLEECREDSLELHKL